MSSPTEPKPERVAAIPRTPTLILLLAAIALGALSRLVPIGVPLWDKSFGDALYALAAYLAWLLVFPASRPAVAFMVVAAWCVFVEAFSLTGMPAQWARSPAGLPFRLLLGTTASLHDVICYLAALTVAAVLHAALRRACSQAA